MKPCAMFAIIDSERVIEFDTRCPPVSTKG
jgi:hypothetical protein